MELEFTDIFSKIEEQEQKAPAVKQAPEVKEFWKEITPGLFQCKITGRKLSRVDFEIYRNHSDCGAIGFVVQVF